MGAHGPKHGRQIRKNTTKGISSWSGDVRAKRIAREREDQETRSQIDRFYRGSRDDG